MTLIAFIPILWLYLQISVPYLDNISGSLVWVALILSIGGIIISWLVGIKLPGLEYNNQKVEAALERSSCMEKMIGKIMFKHLQYFNYSHKI